MDMRCHLSITPTIPSSNGYVKPSTVLKPFDLTVNSQEVKPDHLVLGTSPGKEVTEPDYEYSVHPRVADGVDISTIKIGPDTPKKTLASRSRQETTRRVQNGGLSFLDLSRYDLLKVHCCRDIFQHQGPQGSYRH